MLWEEKQSLELSGVQETKPFLQIKFSNFLELKEEEVSQLIQEIEKDDLFKKLTYPLRDFSLQVIKYRRFPQSRFKPNFFEFCEGVIEGGLSSDLEEVLFSYQNTLKIAKRIGKDNFKKYFLYNEFDLPLEELAKRCRLSKKEVLEVIDMVDKVFLIAKPYQSSLKSRGLSYTKVASLVKVKRGFLIEFLNLDLARGLYEIDYDKLKRLKEEKVFSKEELKKIGSLIEKLTLINFRKSTLFKIISFIIKKQNSFLETSQVENLTPLTQKETAKALSLSLSTVSRAVKYRSLESPWGEEFPLRFFFPSLKLVRIHLLKRLLEKVSFRSDEEIGEELRKRYGIYLSRRTISKYRNELKIKVPKRKK